MKKINFFISSIGGTVGSLCMFLYGSLNLPIEILLLCNVSDLLVGLMLCLFFKKSEKSSDGGFSYLVGVQGFCSKIVMWLFVAIAHQIDKMLGVNYLMNCFIIGFSINELLSMQKNSNIMGLTLPEVFKQMLDLLKDKFNIKGE